MKIQSVRWVCGIHGYFMSVELFKVRVSQNLIHFQWMHLGRRPVTRRVASQCECKGAPAWVTPMLTHWNHHSHFVVHHHLFWAQCFNSLRLRQNRHHFADDIFKCIFLNENVLILIKISLKFIHKGAVNIPSFIQIMAWRWPGNKPLCEPMMIILLTHICVTRSQWVNTLKSKQSGCYFADNILKCIFLTENFWI